MVKILIFSGCVAGILSGFSLLVSCTKATVTCSLIDSYGMIGSILTFIIGFIIGYLSGFLYSLWTLVSIYLFKKITYGDKLSFLLSNFGYLIAFYIYNEGQKPVGLLLAVELSIYTAGLLTFYKYFRTKNMN